jgi:hypothetical protein
VVVEHLRLLHQLLGHGQSAVRVAGEQDSLGELGSRFQVDRIGRAWHALESMGDSGATMASRKRPQDQVQATLRDAVDRTMAVGQQTRSRAQEAVDDLGKAAGRFRQQIEGRTPANHDDLAEIRTELRNLQKRIDKLEKKQAAPKKKK